MELNEYLKKIKVLSRAIYTDVASRAVTEDTQKAYCTKEVVEECIEAAMVYEATFEKFVENSKKLIGEVKNAKE